MQMGDTCREPISAQEWKRETMEPQLPPIIAVSTSNGYVLPETTAIAVVGSFDLLATIYLLATNKAHEANPLMHSILVAFGPWGFVTFKALLLGIPLAIAEYARRRTPVFVRNALRFGLAAYVLLLACAYLPRLVGVLR